MLVGTERSGSKARSGGGTLAQGAYCRTRSTRLASLELEVRKSARRPYERVLEDGSVCRWGGGSLPDPHTLPQDHDQRGRRQVMQKTLERQDLAPYHEAIRDGVQERSTEGPILRCSEMETRLQQLGLAIYFCLLGTLVLASLWRALRITGPIHIVGTVHHWVKPGYAGGSLRRFYGNLGGA